MPRRQPLLLPTSIATPFCRSIQGRFAITGKSEKQGRRTRIRCGQVDEKEVPAWAAEELQKMGPLSGRERTLSVLVLVAITLWMFGGAYVEATTAALIVISLMLIMRVVSWKEMAGNHTAWTTLTLLATLVTLAGGLSRTGFVKWFADGVAAHMGGLSPTFTII